MGRVNTADSLDRLRHANAQLGRFFQRFSGAQVMGTDEEVAALLHTEHTLQSVGAVLDGQLQASQDREIREELARYRKNLLQLRCELARMQESAAGCRARLDSRQKHLHAARAWCAASRATS